MRFPKPRIILFTLAISTLALWTISQQQQQDQAPDVSVSVADRFNWTSSQNITWKINRDKPQQQTTIQTETLRYNEQSKTSEFTQPIVTIIKPKTLTIIHSRQGDSHNDELINLSGNVVITQSSTLTPKKQSDVHKTQNTLLNTQHITYNTVSSALYSHDKITITHPSGQIQGVGLKANLTTGEYQLLSNVQGVYRTQNTSAAKVDSVNH